MKVKILTILLIGLLFFLVVKVNAGEEANVVMMGHFPTGQIDRVKAEIVTTAGMDNNILVVVRGFIEREKYSYSGDRMPGGGSYDDYYFTRRHLDADGNEIKGYVWMSRTVEDAD